MCKDVYKIMQLRKVALSAYDIGLPVIIYGEDFVILAGMKEQIQQQILSNLQNSGKKFWKEDIVPGHTSIVLTLEYIGLDLNTEALSERLKEYLIVEYDIYQMLNIYWKREEVVFSDYLWKNKLVEYDSVILTGLTKKILHLFRKNTQCSVEIGAWTLSLSWVHIPYHTLRKILKYIGESTRSKGY